MDVESVVGATGYTLFRVADVGEIGPPIDSVAEERTGLVSVGAEIA